MVETIARKDLHRKKPSDKTYKLITKKAAILGTAMTAFSVVTPLLGTNEVNADEQAFTTGTTNQQAFIQTIATYAQPIAAQNDLYASVMMAQAIVESGWGASTLSTAPNHNLFGIKGSYNGQSVVKTTSEYINGQWITINAAFRKYPSYGESFQDNARTIKTVSFGKGVYYYSGAWKSNTNSYEDATRWLTGRYATAPNYADVLNRVIRLYNLTKYDTPATGTGQVVGNTTTNTTQNQSGTQTTYTVVRGDYLSKIASQYNVTVAQIKAWNHLSSDLILVGQQLKVGSSQAAPTPDPTPAPTENKNQSQSQSQAKTYTVVSGDYLYKIASQFGVSVGQIKEWNHLSSDLILVGQQLKVGESQVTSAPNTANKQEPQQNQTQTQTQTQTTQAKTYTVVSGDYLYKIASQFGVSVGQIKEWNHLSSDLILVGQQLKIGEGAVTPTTPPVQTQSSTQTHTVVRGDTLWGISLKYGVSINQIKQLSGLNSDIIYVGQSLKVK